ncbi:hypothetical protein Y032_1276g3798 [Ancylostoma ceylanicum]|uniref:Uncharacterized protein n=2 Tax=Ancylostoma ceylanicum TaxID=53326 RepID=A0A016W4Z9_9BILA|nr:hypothetical protein Y032_1276g3798 [Ancylostoma ceylanicum]
MCSSENYADSLMNRGGEPEGLYQYKFGFSGKENKTYTNDYDFLLDAGKDIGIRTKYYLTNEWNVDGRRLRLVPQYMGCSFIGQGKKQAVCLVKFNEFWISRRSP